MLKSSLVLILLLCGLYAEAYATSAVIEHSATSGQLPKLSPSPSTYVSHSSDAGLERNSSSDSDSRLSQSSSGSSEEPSAPSVFKLVGAIADGLTLEGSSGRKIPLYFGDSLQEAIQKADQGVIKQLEEILDELVRGKLKLSKRVKNVSFYLQKDGEITVEPFGGGRW